MQHLFLENGKSKENHCLRISVKSFRFFIRARGRKLFWKKNIQGARLFGTKKYSKKLENFLYATTSASSLDLFVLIFHWYRFIMNYLSCLFGKILTAWKVSHILIEYGEIRSISPYLVRMREKTDQEKLHIWTHFTQCLTIRRGII